MCETKNHGTVCNWKVERRASWFGSTKETGENVVESPDFQACQT
jgi:hypothetical protein